MIICNVSAVNHNPTFACPLPGVIDQTSTPFQSAVYRCDRSLVFAVCTPCRSANRHSSWQLSSSLSDQRTDFTRNATEFPNFPLTRQNLLICRNEFGVEVALTVWGLGTGSSPDSGKDVLCSWRTNCFCLPHLQSVFFLGVKTAGAWSWPLTFSSSVVTNDRYLHSWLGKPHHFDFDKFCSWQNVMYFVRHVSCNKDVVFVSRMRSVSCDWHFGRLR